MVTSTHSNYMDKIDTQGVSFNTTASSTITPFEPVKLTCFTKLEREEIKQMIREVIVELNVNTTAAFYYDKHGSIMERIRDDYHHGGYDKYD